MREVFNLAYEPRAGLLRQLLRVGAGQSHSVMLVVRDGIGLSEGGTALLSALEPHLLERQRSDRWPGTTLLTGEATVLRFAPSPTVIDALLRASDGLYDWQQPNLPEDLALLRDDDSPLLASIAHEQDGYLLLTVDEHRALIEAVPGLAGAISVSDEA